MDTSTPEQAAEAMHKFVAEQRRQLDTDPAWIAARADAQALGLKPQKAWEFKRRHRLPLDQRLSPDARGLLALEPETAKRVAKGEQLKRARALALIAERAIPKAAQALADVLPHPLSFNRLGDAFWIDSKHIEAYLINRVEALSGKRYASAGAAWQRAAVFAPDAAPAAEAVKAEPIGDRNDTRHRLMLFWGVILRLDQLAGPPPADPEAFYSWCQLEACRRHNTWPNIQDLFGGRMAETEARALLLLPISGPLEGGAIRSAYRAQARTAHPDVGGDRHRFEQLAAARDRLLLAWAA